MGGGGSTGSVSYPDYLQDTQSIMMYGRAASVSVNPAAVGSAVPATGLNIMDRVMGGNNQTAMIGTSANPYFGVAHPVPDLELQAAVTELNDLESILDTANLQNHLLDAENTFRDRHKFNLAQSYSRVTAVMAGTGAAMGTAFPTALAMLEVGFNTDIKERRLQNEAQMLSFKVNAVQLRFDYLRNKTAILVDQNRQDTQLNADEELWDLNVYLRALTAIGTISGVSTIKQEGEPGKTQSVLGGMASGASLGAAAGPWGMAIGAGVGGLLGAIG